jgi:hypothetical protein
LGQCFVSAPINGPAPGPWWPPRGDDGAELAVTLRWCQLYRLALALGVIREDSKAENFRLRARTHKAHSHLSFLGQSGH